MADGHALAPQPVARLDVKGVAGGKLTLQLGDRVPLDVYARTASGGFASGPVTVTVLDPTIAKVTP